MGIRGQMGQREKQTKGRRSELNENEKYVT